MTREREEGEASLYAFWRWVAPDNGQAAWGDAIGRVPLYTKATGYQVICANAFWGLPSTQSCPLVPGTGVLQKLNEI